MKNDRWISKEDFFHLAVSAIVGNACGTTSIKNTHTRRNWWALLILINWVTLPSFPFVTEQQTAKSSKCGWQDADGLQPNV